MGRGKSFNHKEKGHEPTIPKHGHQAKTKATGHLEYDIETVASADSSPVSIKEEK